jgi:ribosomal protein S18 acetylase RimI-like enzyme
MNTYKAGVIFMLKALSAGTGKFYTWRYGGTYEVRDVEGVPLFEIHERVIPAPMADGQNYEAVVCRLDDPRSSRIAILKANEFQRGSTKIAYIQWLGTNDAGKANQGLGTALLEGYIKRLKRLGFSKVQLYDASINVITKKASTIYTRLGFTPIDPIDSDASMLQLDLTA